MILFVVTLWIIVGMIYSTCVVCLYVKFTDKNDPHIAYLKTPKGATIVFGAMTAAWPFYLLVSLFSLLRKVLGC